MENINYYYVVFNTASGWIGLLSTDKGICRTTLPQITQESALNTLDIKEKHAEFKPELFREIIKKYHLYFSKQNPRFNELLDLSISTPFEKDVWESTRKIPYGETKSYQWIANDVNNPKAVRAVGQALGRNLCPIIIPCHRVVSANGTLGGFTGGIEIKKQLLALENISANK